MASFTGKSRTRDPVQGEVRGEEMGTEGSCQNDIGAAIGKNKGSALTKRGLKRDLPEGIGKTGRQKLRVPILTPPRKR